MARATKSSMAQAAKAEPVTTKPAPIPTEIKSKKAKKVEEPTMTDAPTPKSTKKTIKTPDTTEPAPAATKVTKNDAVSTDKKTQGNAKTTTKTSTKTTPAEPKAPTKAANNRVAAAIAAARNLRPEKTETFDTMAQKLLPQDFVQAPSKRKSPHPTTPDENLFSEAAIAQATKKQRMLSQHIVAKNNVKTNNKEKKSNSKKNLNSFRQLSDSDDDSDGDDDANNESDVDEWDAKDNYEADGDFDENGNKLVSLTSALLSLHNVRTSEDTEYDKKLGKQADDMYNRKKKVMTTTKDGQKVKTDLSGNPVDFDSLERIDRTVFLGNVPTTAKDSDIKAFLGVPVETIRYRSAGFDTPNLAKWVAFAQKRFHDKRDTLVAFVVLKNADDIQAVLKKNQGLMLEKHIRVDMAGSDGKVDHQRSVFVGNLPYDITEESLFEIFQSCGEIEAIRCVRDNATGIGKGFAFVTFVSKSSVAAGMKLNNQTPEAIGRKIRLTKVSPNAFGKTATFKAEQEKTKALLAKQKLLAKSRSERLKQSVLGPKSSDSDDKKRFKIQGSFQKVVGNSGVGHGKKGRHEARSSQVSAPSWQGNRAKPSDTLGRNKASKKNGTTAKAKGKGRK